MPATSSSGVGKRIAYHRRLARMTQDELARAANIHVGTLRKIERGARGASDSIIDSIAAALGVDPSRLLEARAHTDSRVHDAMPALSAAIAAYDLPDSGAVRSLGDLHAAVDEAVNWRLQAQYVRLSQRMPALLADLTRALHVAGGRERAEVARLMVAAYRAADAVAYKFGHRDLSARLVELMRWAAAQTENELLGQVVAYVRTETFFAARAHTAGLRALEHAIDRSPPPRDAEQTATRGALHMRAAVIASRAGNPDAAQLHIEEARRLASPLREDVYLGTAFGPSSVRIHQVSVAVSLGDEQQALDVAREWKPSKEEVPAERRSGFYIELARAQLWAGLRDDAFESLKVARRIAPQHTREHPWVREDAATLRRLLRADRESLTNFAEWCHAT
jgi:transcriptional regulator with XRE-family HTH domain